MKETIYTIPLNDAVNANDECIFCNIERSVDQDVIDFVLGSGSSYMERDVRDATDKAGFCREHFRKMFEYGNTLGNGWILKTHYMRLNREMQEEFRKYSPQKSSFRARKRKESGKTNPVSMWIAEKEKSCYACKWFADAYDRYMDTFFYMYKRDEDFRKKVLSGKGFCLHHFGDLCEYGETVLNEQEKKEFYPAMFELMGRNMARIQEDVNWLVEKFDYRNRDADWRDSKDAIQKGMQKLRGGYPADPPYKMNK